MVSLQRVLHLSSRIGQELRGKKEAYGLNIFFPLLQHLGFAPEHIIDVGANHGNWTRAAMRYFPDAAYTLVEPQAHLQASVKALRNVTWINAGCSDAPGLLPFTVSERDDSSTFVLVDQHGQSTGSQQINVPLMTLNQIVSSSPNPFPEMVKIDAEGFDLKVLAGSSELFGKTEIFLVEAVICANYENTISRVIQFMDGVGYSLMDITDINRSPTHGVLWLCELAFARNGSNLLSKVSSY